VSARRYVAVDLGASSGRVIAGSVTESSVELTELHRFANEPVRLPDGLHWDIVGLHRQIQRGLADAGPVASAGIDSWAVDYGLIDDDGALLALPYHYRDSRTSKVPAWPDAAGLYGVTGIAELPFNTLHQLRAEPPHRLDAAAHLLLIPDLLGFWLTGQVGAEHTNASTTQLYDVQGGWSTSVAQAAGIPARILPAIRHPGDLIGVTDTGIPLRAVASHDTASAVAAVPADGDRFAYISCGTWSLVGLELQRPVLSEAARLAAFTNESGVDGTIRFLRNVMGLWLLQECQRFWRDDSAEALIAQAAQATPFAALIDPQDSCWLAPGDEPGGMPARIAAHADGRRPQTKGEVVRCILESLAYGHRAAIAEATALSGHSVEVIHLVGGGGRNELLCQMTADATGLPVLAGPVEATALGNLLIQARADGVLADLAELRALVRATQQVVSYQPRRSSVWDDAAARIEAMRHQVQGRPT
jgi:rhamnulokinase